MLTFDSTMISNMIFYTIVFFVWRLVRGAFRPESTRMGTFAAYGCFIIMSWVCIFAPINIFGMDTPRKLFFIPLISLGGFLVSFVVSINMFCKLGSCKVERAKIVPASSASQLGCAERPALHSPGIGGNTERQSAGNSVKDTNIHYDAASFFSSVKSKAKRVKVGFENTVLPREQKYNYRKMGE